MVNLQERKRRTYELKRVFEAHKGYRSILIRVAAVSSIVIVTLWIGVGILNLLLIRPLPHQNRDDPAQFQGPSFSSISPSPATDARPLPKSEPTVTPTPIPADPPNYPRATPKAVYAMLENWPRNSFEALRRHMGDVDVIVPHWLQVNDTGTGVEAHDSWRQSQIETALLPMLTTQKIIPMVDGEFPDVANDSLINGMVQEVTHHQYDGLCLNLSWLTPRQTRARLALVTALRQALVPLGKQTCVIIDIVGRDLPLEQINAVSDVVIGIPFDEPGPGDIVGPIASQARFASKTMGNIARISPGKLVLAMGNQQADWPQGKPAGHPLSCAEVARLAGLHNAPIVFDRNSLTPKFFYSESNGARHQIFMVDATTAYNQLVTIGPKDIGGIAIWPIGGEDPGIWSLAKPAPQRSPRDLLRRVSIANYVGKEGEGDFFTAFGSPTTGIREISTDPDTGLITSVKYTTLPQTYTVAHWGNNVRDKIALTFDDGPDILYTPPILKILHDLNVPAAFFMIGEKAIHEPDLVRRVFAEGHEIGVHTFTHPNVGMISDTRLMLEVAATQRVLANATGYNTVLFRAPFGEDSDPSTPAEVRPIALVSAAGYLSAGMQIDPHDWHRPGVDKIIERVRSDALETGGGILLLHDSGGDRSETIEALPKIIAMLRSEGFHFVSLADMLGVPPDAMMPPVSAREQNNVLANIQTYVSIYVWGILGVVVTYAFAAAIALGVIRAILVILFAVLRKRHGSKASAVVAPVSVLVPAYNESAVIVKTIDAILASSYPDIHVVVIDDGSTDDTYALVTKTFESDPRVTSLHQTNQGKAAALNYGYAMIDTDVVISIDADTIVEPDAIGILVAHFNDPTIGAVSGNVKVGNRVNLVTRLQAIEYITSQNLDRRAFEVFNAIFVVPGAIGAWRRTAVLRVGGYTLETLAEDADLTVAIIRSGYRVIYDERAIAMTEAPESLKQLMRQRLRWTLGIMQVGWKHRRAVREHSGIGLVALPNILVFGTLLPLLAPIADLMVVVSLLRFLRDLIQHPTLAGEIFSPTVLAFYVIFILFDVVLASVGFLLEPREDGWLLLRVVFQRFFYRQLLYIAVLRSLWHALTGRLTKWRKIVRSADVFVP